MRPVVTLHHFTHPKWFHRETPWHEPESVEAFRRYAQVCARDPRRAWTRWSSPSTSRWCCCSAATSRASSRRASPTARKAMAALGNIGRAHVAAREEMLAECGKTELGISQNMLAFAPDRCVAPAGPGARAAGRRRLQPRVPRGARHRASCASSCPAWPPRGRRIDGGRDSIDFVGHQLLHARAPALRAAAAVHRVQVPRRARAAGSPTSAGRTTRRASARCCSRLKRYGLPVWITENGIDDRDGRPAAAVPPHALEAGARGARKQGVDVRGYLYWTLLDNFEWLEGWGPRFGLYHVDFETLERRPTPGLRVLQAGGHAASALCPGSPVIPRGT